MQEYRVGQILFLISNSKVIPVQVVEEVIRTTLRGKEKTYMVMFPDKEQTIVDIQKIKSEIFLSKEALRLFMIDNATKAIDEMIKSASQIVIGVFSDNSEDDINEAQESFESKVIDFKKIETNSSKEENNKNIQKVQNSNNNNIIKVDLGNGRIGKIKTDNLEEYKE